MPPVTPEEDGTVMAKEFDMRVTNAREIRQAFRRLEKDVQKDLQRELRSVAAPVAQTARELGQAAGLADSTIQAIRPRTSVGIAKVQDTKRRTTGKHPEYGRKVMTQALIPALRAHAARIIVEVAAAMDRATARFNRG